jgi:hypothetical protein
MLKTHIMPHDEFMEMVRRMNPSQQPALPQEASILKRIIGLEQQRKVTVPEELAQILVAIFGRKTSVVFDMAAVLEIIAQESTSVDDRELLAHTMFLAIASAKQQAPSSEIFKRYIDLAISQLQLTTLNELI